MNNEMMNELRVALTTPEKIKTSSGISFDTPILYRIAGALYTYEWILFLINIIICLSTVKRIKQNRIWVAVSIVVFIIACGSNVIRDFVGGLESKQIIEQRTEICNTLMIISFIIQIVIFIKLIINIVKNRKKEEP